MNYSTGTEGYYRKMLELQEKLRRSEEERMKLEEKFNETMRYTRDAEHERLRVLRHKYHRFLEEDRIRQERNENILRALDRIESRAKTFAAKTDRFKALRKQYDAYIRRIYSTKHQKPEVYTRAQQNSDSHPYQSYPNARKQLFVDSPATQRSDTKIAMLEQYLQDNFNSFPKQKTRESVFNENQMFSRQNGFSAGYALPEELSENRNHLRQNYRQSETVVDSDSKDSQEYNVENGFPSRRSDPRLAQNEVEFVPRLPEKDYLQLKKTEKSELLGNTIEQELDRFRDKESAKQKSDIEVVQESTPDPYVQNYKDLVSKSAKKFGLHNGSLTKRTSDQNIDIADEEKLNSSVNVLDQSVMKSNDPVSNKIVPDAASSKQREENKVNFAKHQENQDNESSIIRKTLKAEDIENVKRNEAELLGDQQLVSPEPASTAIDHGEVQPCMEKLEVLEQDDNVDMSSKTPEVSSARTEPPDDVTLTTSSPIDLPLSAENIATHKQEPDNVAHNKNSPVHLDGKLIESAVVQQASISKDLQSNNAQDSLIPRVTDTEQSDSANENMVTENQNNPLQHESQDGENYVEPNQELDQNYPVDQAVYENQDYQNVEGQQVYQEEYQPQDGYDPQSYPVQEHVDDQPAVYDAEQYLMGQQQYPVDQQQYPADEEHYPVDQKQYPADQQQYPADEEHYPVDQKQYPADQQYSVDQEHYGVDQQHYPTDQEQHVVSQKEYPTDQQPYPVDQQQYSADQYPLDEQKYPGTDAEQYPVTQQEYPVDKEQYRQDQQYPTDQQEYPVDKEQYRQDQQYPIDQQEYPVDKEQYRQDQQYPTDQQTYPTDQEQYPVDSQQYSAHQQPYITDEQQYAPVQQHYSTDEQEYQGEYPPGQYPGEPQQYIEGQPADYDPTEYPQNYVAEQPYTEGEYEAQQYPGGYNQDVYRSGQEYLQGEQNIDLQYQAEVTGQEYLEEFPSQGNQPQEQQDGISEQDHQPHQSITPQQSSSEPVQRQVKQETCLPVKENISESLEKSATQNVVQPEDKPLVEKKLPNLADMLDTDTESTRQETKVSNDSDFDFSNT